MAISIIYGPGGSGKSMWQMHVIVRELRDSKRNIVTNMALNVPEFNEYLEQRYPRESLDLLARLRILTRDETLEFWKLRGPVRYTGPGEYDYTTDAGGNGVAFVIDEAGAAGFNAIGWAQRTSRATRGEEFSWYLDQQRKFSDNVYMSTNGRMPHGIAKPVRDKAHDFTRLKNGALSSYGLFRGVPKFYRYHYAVEPDKHTEPYQQGTFALDFAGLGRCYRTQDGIGIIGNGADKGTRAKGLPIWVMVPAVMGLGLLCVAIPWFGGRGVSRWISGDTKAKVEKITAGTPLSVAKPVMPASIATALYPGKNIPPGQPGPVSLVERPPVGLEPASKLYVVGWAMRGNRVNVLMSDGTLITEAGGELQSKPPYPGYVWINGQRVPFKPAPRGPVAPVAGVPYRYPGAWLEGPQDGQGLPSERAGSADVETLHGGPRSVRPAALDSSPKREGVRHETTAKSYVTRSSLRGPVTVAIQANKKR